MAPYQDDLTDAINYGIIESLKEISEGWGGLANYLRKQNDPLKLVFNHSFIDALNEHVRVALNSVFNKIFNDRYTNYVLKPRKKDPQGEEANRARTALVKDELGKYLNTDWRQKSDFVVTSSAGYVESGEYKINLSDKYLQLIMDLIVEYVKTNLNEHSKNSNPADTILSVLDYLVSNEHEVNKICYRVIVRLLQTIEHEMVHAIQNFEQVALRKRDDTQYRSYAQKDKAEFDQSIGNDKKTTRERKMFVSSPQEILAVAHGLVVKIISELDVDASSKNLERIDPNSILRAVKLWLSQTIPNPTSPVELKVYKRYLRLVYLGVMNYIERKNQDRRKNRQLRVSNQGKLPK